MKKEHTVWSSIPTIGMPDHTKLKENDARAKRCFVGQFPDLDGTSAWNISRNISAPILDLLVIETNRYASQKNDQLCTVSSLEIQKSVGLIILSAYNSRRNFHVYRSKSRNFRVQSLHGDNEPIKIPPDEILFPHVQ